MKSLFNICIAITVVFAVTSMTPSRDSDAEYTDYKDVIGRNIINDTVLNIIDGKKFLYYTTGHHYHNWSMVIPRDDYYVILSGNTWEKNLCVDTVFSSSVLKWGLDSLELYCNKMTPIKRTKYVSGYNQLALISFDNKVVCNYCNIIGFSGPDSVVFNKKYHRLGYLMFYAAAPSNFKEKLPTPQL